MFIASYSLSVYGRIRHIIFVSRHIASRKNKYTIINKTKNVGYYISLEHTKHYKNSGTDYADLKSPINTQSSSAFSCLYKTVFRDRLKEVLSLIVVGRLSHRCAAVLANVRSP